MKRRVTLRFKLLLLLICIIYACVVIVGQASTVHDQNLLRDDLQRELAAVKYEQEYLKNKLAYINTAEYIEEAARARFGWVRPDETVYESVD